MRGPHAIRRECAQALEKFARRAIDNRARARACSLMTATMSAWAGAPSRELLFFLHLRSSGAHPKSPCTFDARSLSIATSRGGWTGEPSRRYNSIEAGGLDHGGIFRKDLG